MNSLFSLFAAQVPPTITYGVVLVILAVVTLVLVWIALAYGNLWFQAYMSNARVEPAAAGRHELSAGRTPG